MKLVIMRHNQVQEITGSLLKLSTALFQREAGLPPSPTGTRTRLGMKFYIRWVLVRKEGLGRGRVN